MAKGKAKRDERGPLQRAYDRDLANENNAPLVNEFAARHGDYERNMRFVANRGGTAIDRWRKDDRLSDSQLAAILHCQTLWAKIGSRSVVADFNRVRGQPHGEGLSQHEALTELGKIAAEFPPVYWDVFENVCRHDLPAGVAGSRLANVKKAAEVTARCIVCFVADIIAMKWRLSY